MAKVVNPKLIRLSLLAIIALELASFLGHFYPAVEQAGFFVILATTLVLSIYRLQYGVLIGLAELIIGSQGHLFMFTAGGQEISIRIGLWLVVLAVWAAKSITGLLKTDKAALTNIPFRLKQSELIPYFAVLFMFIGWGVINGLLQGHDFGSIFFDANGWLYFAWIFPLFTVAKEQDFFANVLSVFASGIIWLAAKTFILLYIFTHEIGFLKDELYTWVRDTRVGEITDMKGGFYRIFFQSHIFLLAGFFVFLSLWWRRANNFLQENKTRLSKPLKDKQAATYLVITVVCLSITLMSLSRSNWAGLLVGSLGFLVLILLSRSGLFKKLYTLFGYGLISTVLAIGLIAAVVSFPLPQPGQGAGTAKTISDRSKNVDQEAGAASRWSLLPELWEEVKQAPVLGKGFGATVTYRSSDPRVLASSPDGEYTTFAFEWGWLDIWLKLGIFGLLSYLALSAIIIFKSLKRFFRLSRDHQAVMAGFALGLAAILGVNFFSPYLNHPLGIGYILLLSALYIHTTSSNFHTSK